MRQIEFDAEEIRRLYWDEGNTLREVAQKLGHNHILIIEFMKKHNIPRRKKSERMHTKSVSTNWSEEDIKKLYLDENKSVPMIAEIYNVTCDIVYAFMRKHNISRRRNSAKFYYTEKEDTMLNLLNNQQPTTTRGMTMESLEAKNEQEDKVKPIHQYVDNLKSDRDSLELQILKVNTDMDKLEDTIRSTNSLKIRKKDVLKKQLDWMAAEKQSLTDDRDEIVAKIKLWEFNANLSDIAVEINQTGKSLQKISDNLIILLASTFGSPE